MKSNLLALIPYFKDYGQHICLIISEFKDSEKKTKNIHSINTQLVIPNDLQELAIQIIGSEREQDILECNGHQFVGSEIIKFFRQSMHHTDSFQLDPKVMGLEIIIDPAILQQLHQITNTQYKYSGQQLDYQDIPLSSVANEKNINKQNQEKFGQIQSKVSQTTNIENSISYETRKNGKQFQIQNKNKQENDYQKGKKPIQEEVQEVRIKDNQSISWFGQFIQWFKKLFK